MRNGRSVFFSLVSAALLCASAPAGAGDGLWGSQNLIADAKVEPGDIVTIVISQAREAGEASEGAAGETRHTPAQTAAARAVKRLPNGNVVLEAKVRPGRGYILISGEAARADIAGDRGAGWTVHISRVANLAVVARGLGAEAVSALMRSLGRSRGDVRFAPSGPAEGRRRRRGDSK